MTNKLTLVKKAQNTQRKEIKHKRTGLCSPVRTAYTSVHIIQYSCSTQNSFDTPPSRQSSAATYA